MCQCNADVLDWLAVDLVEHDWDIKRLVRWIVTSRTYLQDSYASPEALTKDPKNRLLARGARYRMASWMLRDIALSHAELISRPIGGPPVRPYQPDGVWEELFMGRYQYLPSEGSFAVSTNAVCVLAAIDCTYVFIRYGSAPRLRSASLVARTHPCKRSLCGTMQPTWNAPLQSPRWPASDCQSRRTSGLDVRARAVPRSRSSRARGLEAPVGSGPGLLST